jgi:glutaminyl-peptide cyclotransferase
MSQDGPETASRFAWSRWGGGAPWTAGFARPMLATARRVAVLLGLATAALLVACGGTQTAPPAPPLEEVAEFDAERALGDVRRQVEFGAREASSVANRIQAEFLAAELESAGVSDVQIQEPDLNVVGAIPGAEAGSVVVGAHHDTKDIAGFVGANDGASGVAVVLELARALPERLDGPSLALALFDAEEARGDRPFDEDGTRGSRQYVRYAEDGGLQGSPPFDEIRAMVLFDLVGDCELQIPREENSDEALYDLFAEAALDAGLAELVGGELGSSAPFTGTTSSILDDHIPFQDAGIPAVDLIDLTFGPGGAPGEFWHTDADTLDKVCVESLDAVGQAAVRAIPRIR